MYLASIAAPGAGPALVWISAYVRTRDRGLAWQLLRVLELQAACLAALLALQVPVALLLVSGLPWTRDPAFAPVRTAFLLADLAVALQLHLLPAALGAVTWRAWGFAWAYPAACRSVRPGGPLPEAVHRMATPPVPAPPAPPRQVRKPGLVSVTMSARRA
jgi:hypothetical protein